MILGTAGHIDHGKTSLIKLLTGIDTDRLKDEKIRGMSIELGFAHLELPDGDPVGIIDVPGHDKFIKTMVAGAYCMDLVILVIASDEGIMPQTVEHLEILELLGVKKGIIALTKTDLVERDWIDFMEEEIKSFLKGSPFERSPIVRVSSKTGEGKEELINLIFKFGKELKDQRKSDIFRLPIDRVFSLRGFGTVITGTVIGGEVGIGDEVELSPKGLIGRVRGIEIHSKKVEHSLEGFRTAINLKGIEREGIERGDVLIHPGMIKPSSILDVTLKSLKRGIRNNSLVNFYTGTSSNIGRVILLDKEELKGYDTGYAQIRLNAPLVALPGDRFIIRDAGITLGGGKILDVYPRKHKRFSKDILSELSVYAGEDEKRVIESYILKEGITDVEDIRIKRNIPRYRISIGIDELMKEGKVKEIEGSLIHTDTLFRLKTMILEHLKEYHSRYPKRLFMKKEDLKSKLPFGMGDRIFDEILSMLVDSGEIFMEGENLRLSTHRVRIEDGMRERVIRIFKESGLTPPGIEELKEKTGTSEEELIGVISLLLKERILIRVKHDLYIYKENVEELKERILKKYQEGKEEFTIKDFKEMAGISRKYLIPILEYLDSTRFTIRIGDKRRLRI